MTNSNLTDQVAARLAPLLPAHSSILIGLSGGVDSVVLLHLLHKLATRFSWQLSALHVHHGISPNADKWADFCADLCAHHLISLHIERVDIAPLRAHGIEAAARKLRHAAFTGQSCDFVALAHHADDQAETLLLQLLRGAGARGASAMPVLSLMEPQAIRPSCQETPAKPLVMPKRPLPAGRKDSLNFLRPLLHCSRQEILDYAVAHQLHWIEDESNADDSYPRNFLRHRVMPLLGEKFPACRDTLARSAQHFAEASELLDDLARLDAPDLFHTGAKGEGGERGECYNLEVSRLQSLSQTRAKNLLRYFLHSIGAPMPQAVQLGDMLQQLCNARQDAAVCIGYGGDWQVRRYRGRIYVLRAPGDFDRNLVLPWRGESYLDWPALHMRLRFDSTQASGISLEKLQRAPVTLRLRHGGETLRPYPNAPTRTLKNLLQEHRIQPWQRDRLPLLYCGEELVCVPGVAIAAEYQAAAKEAGVRLNMKAIG
ncbi:MAG: tRNA lysidine(34) synthetase TilS [Gallionella sp.]|nr:tRNA lysidine(34) synthetase TilS [Gallionella sp.]